MSEFSISKEVWDSIFPRLSKKSKKIKGKVIITSTPKGENYFYKLYKETFKAET